MNKKELIKILVVEDEKFWVDILKREIQERKLPWELEWVQNGKKAVELFQGGSTYDGVLMNLEMPLMDGDQATKVIRRLGIKTPIIAWTAHSQWSFGKGCMNMGMNGFVEKWYPRLIEDTMDALRKCQVITA